MTEKERLADIIASLEQEKSHLLSRIEKRAGEERIPIIRKETGALLRTLIAAVKPEKILEVGTAVGYSALLMAEVMPAGGQITTIEKYEKRIPQARKNFSEAGREAQIHLIEGDAGEIIPTLPEESYEFIFMDAAKGQYIHFLPDVLRLLRTGGLLVSDNVLQDGDIMESRFAVTRRNRTIHARMREYLYGIKHHERLETVILQVGDGVALSVKKED